MNATDLKAWRQRMGLTQAQAAVLFDCCRTHVCNMELGRKPVTPETARIALIAEHGPCPLCEGIGHAQSDSGHESRLRIISEQQALAGHALAA